MLLGLIDDMGVYKCPRGWKHHWKVVAWTPHELYPDGLCPVERVCQKCGRTETHQADQIGGWYKIRG